MGYLLRRGLRTSLLSRWLGLSLCVVVLFALACDRRTGGEDCRQCVIGQQKCASDFKGILICKQIISTGCIQFTLQRCDPGLVCVTSPTGGPVTCQTEGQNCTTQCVIGNKRCEGETITVCSTEAATGCPIWKPERTCGAGKPCQNGVCQGEPPPGCTQDSDCGAGQKCQAGTCVPDNSGCTPTNPQHQKKCVGNDVYWFDDCDKQGAVVEQCVGTCQNGACQNTGPCTPKVPEHQKKCVGKNVHWFDDCDQQGALIESCPDICENGACKTANGCTPTDNMYQKKCDGNQVYWYDDCGGKRAIVEDCTPLNKKCQNGVCDEPGCTGGVNQCAAIDSRCSGTTGVQSCTKNPGNGCFEWGPVVPCGAGTLCQGGQCVRDPNNSGGQCSTSKTGGQCANDFECCANQSCKKVLFLFDLCGPCNSAADCPKAGGLPMQCCGTGASSYCAPACL